LHKASRHRPISAPYFDGVQPLSVPDVLLGHPFLLEIDELLFPSNSPFPAALPAVLFGSRCYSFYSILGRYAITQFFKSSDALFPVNLPPPLWQVYSFSLDEIAPLRCRSLPLSWVCNPFAPPPRDYRFPESLSDSGSKADVLGPFLHLTGLEDSCPHLLRTVSPLTRPFAQSIFRPA